MWLTPQLPLSLVMKSPEVIEAIRRLHNGVSSKVTSRSKGNLMDHIPSNLMGHIPGFVAVGGTPSQSTDVSSGTQFQNFPLPRELIDNILSFLLAPETISIHKEEGSIKRRFFHTDILKVNRTLRHQASQYLYSHHTFAVFTHNLFEPHLFEHVSGIAPILGADPAKFSYHAAEIRCMKVGKSATYRATYPQEQFLVLGEDLPLICHALQIYYFESAPRALWITSTPGRPLETHVTEKVPQTLETHFDFRTTEFAQPTRTMRNILTPFRDFVTPGQVVEVAGDKIPRILKKAVAASMAPTIISTHAVVKSMLTTMLAVKALADTSAAKGELWNAVMQYESVSKGADWWDHVQDLTEIADSSVDLHLIRSMEEIAILAQEAITACGVIRLALKVPYEFVSRTRGLRTQGLNYPLTGPTAQKFCHLVWLSRLTTKARDGKIARQWVQDVLTHLRGVVHMAAGNAELAKDIKALDAQLKLHPEEDDFELDYSKLTLYNSAVSAASAPMSTQSQLPSFPVPHSTSTPFPTSEPTQTHTATHPTSPPTSPPPSIFSSLASSSKPLHALKFLRKKEKNRDKGKEKASSKSTTKDKSKDKGKQPLQMKMVYQSAWLDTRIITQLTKQERDRIHHLQQELGLKKTEFGAYGGGFE